MPISPFDYERAEDYVTERLSAGERTQFETELAANPELAGETARLRSLRTGLRRLTYRNEIAARHAELLQHGDIQAMPTEMGRVLPLGRTRSLWSYAAAASVVLLLGLGWFLVENNVGSSPADLADRYPVRELRLEPTTRNGEPLLTSPGPDQLARREAIARDTTAIRAGLALLQQNKPAEAIARLQPARNCSLPDWQANARYLLALSYLKTGQTAPAKAELTALRQTTYFGQEAGQLLNELSGK